MHLTLVKGVDIVQVRPPWMQKQTIAYQYFFFKAYIHMFQDGSTLIPWTNSISGGRVLSVWVIIGLLGG